MNEFIWTDDLVHEYVRELIMGELGKEYNHMENFKNGKPNAISNDKREWEITSFKCRDKIYSISNYDHNFDRYWSDSKRTNYVERRDYECFIKNNDYSTLFSIHSVLRKSDNTVWSVGDDTPQGKICAFDVIGNDMAVEVEKTTRLSIRLSDLRKLKPPLFITEDGKAIYEGEYYYFVLGDWQVRKTRNQIYSSSVMTFSTENAALEYIAKHKPKPYVVFIKPTYGSEMFVPYNFEDVMVNDESSHQRFETKDEALAFCIDNAKLFSVKDIQSNSFGISRAPFEGIYKIDIAKFMHLAKEKLNRL